MGTRDALELTFARSYFLCVASATTSTSALSDDIEFRPRVFEINVVVNRV